MKAMCRNLVLLFKVGIVLLAFSGCGKNEDNPVETSIVKPTANVAENISKTSFTASWNRVYMAQAYQLDVSTSKLFETFLSGFQNLAVSASFQDVTGLIPNTTYYYRARTTSNGKTSENSNSIEVKTLPDLTNVTLKGSAKDLYVGTCVQASKLTGSYNSILVNEFSSLTAEYEMKMNIFMPTQTSFDQKSYNFGPGDAIVNYASNNGMNVHGHALIWHNSTPLWIQNFAGSNTEFESVIKTYITDVVKHYKGKVKSWDVVNEAFEDGSESLRNSIFYQKLGADYIAKCFQWVKDADPEVLIFYNDYNLEADLKKRSAAFSMIDNLISRRVPVNGIGQQLHISYDGPSKAQIETVSQMITSRNLLVHYSELDIRANPRNELTSLTQERALAQKAKYKEVVQVFNALPKANKYAITLWGMKDNESWLIDFWKQADWPLLFDSSFQKKEAYNGFIEGLMN